jgi:hypothetical protein
VLLGHREDERGAHRRRRVERLLLALRRIPRVPESPLQIGGEIRSFAGCCNVSHRLNSARARSHQEKCQRYDCTSFVANARGFHDDQTKRRGRESQKSAEGVDWNLDRSAGRLLSWRIRPKLQ